LTSDAPAEISGADLSVFLCFFAISEDRFMPVLALRTRSRQSTAAINCRDRETIPRNIDR